MRYLHVVGISESFVASGLYLHEHGSKWRQEWNIHELPDGARLIRVDDDQRGLNGRSILTEAWVSPASEGGKIARIDLDVYGGPDDELRHLRATYSFFDDHLEVGRTLNKDERRFSEQPLPAASVITSGALILKACMLAELLKTDQPRSVISHNEDFSGEEAFSPLMQQCAARVETSGSVKLGSKSYEARMLHLNCDGQDDGSHIWLDAQNVILRQDSNQDSPAIILTDYAHR